MPKNMCNYKYIASCLATGDLCYNIKYFHKYEINISLRCKYINHACLQKNVLTCSCIIATTESTNECDKV